MHTKLMNTLSRIFQPFFRDENFSIETQKLFIMLFNGVFYGTTVSFLFFFFHYKKIIWISSSITALCVIATIVLYKYEGKNKYITHTYIERYLAFLVCCFFIQIAYFTVDEHIQKSIFIVLSFSILFFLLDIKDLLSFIPLYCLIFFSTDIYLHGFYSPQRGDDLFNIFFSMIIGACLGTLFFFFKLTIYKNRSRIMDLAQSLNKSSRQAQALNALSLFLSDASAEHEATRAHKACALLQKDLDLDALALWRAVNISGTLYCKRLTTGVDEESLPALLYTDLPESVRNNFAKNASISSRTDVLAYATTNLFDVRDMSVFTATPIFHNDLFWGFIAAGSREKNQLKEMQRSLQTAGLLLCSFVEKEELTKALIKATQEKSLFLANMSHEIRTPLNAITGMTSIGRNARDQEKKDYCFDRISAASSHLLGVVNNILDMSKIESGKFSLSPAQFDFEAMLQNIVNLVIFKTHEKRQKLSVRLDGAIPGLLVGDEQQLSQIILNLLGNAVKFTPEQGAISLKTCLAARDAQTCTIQFDITDTGPGISPEKQAHLFMPFEQAHADSVRRFGGTGLGLCISRRLVEMMDGTIWFVTEQDKGSTFSFTVRLKRAATEQKTLLSSGRCWNGMRALAVDDDREVRESFQKIVTGFGLVCHTAANGQEALALAREGEGYHIYFIDLKMPGMTGLELTRSLKAFDGRKPIVILLSFGEWESVEAEARRAGVDSFLTKPLFPSSIADCINRCLGAKNLVPTRTQPEQPADSFAGHCLLLAEDVKINQEIVGALLEPTGLTIDYAEDGLEAVRMFQENPQRYSMIFMDIQMPNMNGYDAAQKIRRLSEPRARDIPIVAMTANVFRENIEKCLAVGMNGHVGKPLDMQRVMQVLRQYLSRSPQAE